MSQLQRSDPDRERMIAEAAYFRAERRGFTGGDPLTDWLEAEAEITARLGAAEVAPAKPRRTAGARKAAAAPAPRKRRGN